MFVILSEAVHFTTQPNTAVILSERSEPKDPRISRGQPPVRVPHLRLSRAFARLRLRWVSFAIAIAAISLFTAPAHAQGCSQCLDSTRATPPAVQASYRHAIYLLGGAGVTLFLAGLILLRREP